MPGPRPRRRRALRPAHLPRGRAGGGRRGGAGRHEPVRRRGGGGHGPIGRRDTNRPARTSGPSSTSSSSCRRTAPSTTTTAPTRACAASTTTRRASLGAFAQAWPGGPRPHAAALPPRHGLGHRRVHQRPRPQLAGRAPEPGQRATTARSSRTHTQPAVRGARARRPDHGLLPARSDLPFYYALADAFTICDNYHCSVLGPTHPNRLMALSGTLDPSRARPAARCSSPTSRPTPSTACSWDTMPEVLEDAGVSWKVYNPAGDDLRAGLLREERDARDDAILPYFRQYTNPRVGAVPEGVPAAVPERLRDRRRVGHSCPRSAGSSRPSATTSTRPSPPALGEWFTSQVLATLVSNPTVWSKTVLFHMYDENDGFFDHVPPPVPPTGTPGEYLTGAPLPADANGIRGPVGMGFRVPMLVLSPFSRGGHVASEVFDHTSQLRFLEERFGVQAPNISAWRRRTAGDLTSTLHMGQRRHVGAHAAQHGPRPDGGHGRPRVLGGRHPRSQRRHAASTRSRCTSRCRARRRRRASGHIEDHAARDYDCVMCSSTSPSVRRRVAGPVLVGSGAAARGEGMLAAGDVGQVPHRRRAGGPDLRVAQGGAGGGLVVLEERRDAGGRREPGSAGFRRHGPGDGRLAECGALPHSRHAVPVVDRHDVAAVQTDVPGRPVGVGDDRHAFLFLVPYLGGPLREVVDPPSGLRLQLEVEERAMGLRVEPDGGTAEGMLVEPAQSPHVAAEPDLAGQSRRGGAPRLRRAVRGHAGIGEPRLDHDEVRSVRLEWGRTAEGSGAGVSESAQMLLDDPHRIEERMGPAILVGLEDDPAPRGENHARHAPGRGAVEQALRRAFPERGDAEPGDDLVDRGGVIAAEDGPLDVGHAPAGQLRGDDLGDRAHAP